MARNYRKFNAKNLRVSCYTQNFHHFHKYSLYLKLNGSIIVMNSLQIFLNYLCDFVIRDITIAVYLESPWKINFNLVSDFFVTFKRLKRNSEKMGFNYS